jgi:hypothetical protein
MQTAESDLRRSSGTNQLTMEPVSVTYESTTATNLLTTNNRDFEEAAEYNALWDESFPKEMFGEDAMRDIFDLCSFEQGSNSVDAALYPEDLYGQSTSTNSTESAEMPYTWNAEQFAEIYPGTTVQDSFFLTEEPALSNPGEMPEVQSADPPRARRESRTRKSTSAVPKASSLRRGHAAGIDKKTGEMTLVGKFPPVMVGSYFTCPNADSDCEAKQPGWTTKNGYKYHLKHTCTRNPLSVRSVRIAMGLPVRALSTGGRVCTCGMKFKSPNGFKMHQTQNESTRDGRCMNRLRRGREVEVQGAEMAAPLEKPEQYGGTVEADTETGYPDELFTMAMDEVLRQYTE